MKTIFQLLAAFMVISPFAALSQSSGIDVALNKGNAVDLSGFLAEKVDVSILGKDASLTATDAIVPINNFFTQNVVKSYKRVHLTAAANGKSSYSLGELVTSTGTYRIYIYFDSKQKISEIRIEK